MICVAQTDKRAGGVSLHTRPSWGVHNNTVQIVFKKFFVQSIISSNRHIKGFSL